MALYSEKSLMKNNFFATKASLIHEKANVKIVKHRSHEDSTRPYSEFKL